MAGKYRESPEVGAAVLRMMRALVVRAGTGDTEALEWLAQLEAEAARLVIEAGRAAHVHYTYTELAAVLGVSRQAVRQRLIGSAAGPGGPPAELTD